MERKVDIKICDVVKHVRELEPEIAQDFEDNDDVESIDLNDENCAQHELDVDITGINAEAVELPAIHDEHGRISDIFEALERSTGLSVIPFAMGNVAPEVSSLARHKIFEFDGKRYAMSHKMRSDAIDSFHTRIMKTLTSGISFSEELNTVILYNNEEYQTFSLSEDEWTYIIARFRNYKSRLYVDNNKKFILEIIPERR